MGEQHAGQYFEPEPQVRSRPATLRLTLPDVTLDLRTDRGVFSHRGIDPGTKYLLLDGPTPASTGDLVDLGCGYGPIALALARRSPAATVWALDVNERAVDLCVRNAAAAGLANVRGLVAADVADAVARGLPEAVRPVEIWSNPPIRIGKAALHALLSGWFGLLADDGRAVLVVHKHLGADSLARWLADEGWATARRGSRGGYRLLEVSRAGGAGPSAGPGAGPGGGAQGGSPCAP